QPMAQPMAQSTATGPTAQPPSAMTPRTSANGIPTLGRPGSGASPSPSNGAGPGAMASGAPSFPPAVAPTDATGSSIGGPPPWTGPVPPHTGAPSAGKLAGAAPQPNSAAIPGAHVGQPR